MRITGTVLVAGLLVASAIHAADDPLRIADRVVLESPGDVRIANVLVVGISDDREVRNRFEDRFVTHLRGRGVQASASHSIVPDLTDLEGRDRILGAIYAEGIDAVLTVRAVRVERRGDADWIAAWDAWSAAASTPRELIEANLPITGKQAKRYGVEFALWEIAGPRRLWAARSDVVKRKRLDDGSGDLLQAAIADLRDRGWF
jgi:hypothetical protein